MQNNYKISAFTLGGFIFLGLAALGYLLSSAIIEFKQFDRSVTVKGLSEKALPADIVIWPIQFTSASNDLNQLYATLEVNTNKIKRHLNAHDISDAEITLASPAITDKSAQQYGNDLAPKFRYTALQTVTVYSKQIDQVRKVMSTLSELGKAGIVFIGNDYETEYLFTRLNEIKPSMIEEATTNARAVANKFATDSNSKLGKIKQASQGQFSISARDKNNPHIKNIRVVSTVEYYLSD